MKLLSFISQLFSHEKKTDEELADSGLMLIQAYYFLVILFFQKYLAYWDLLSTKPQLIDSWLSGWLFSSPERSLFLGVIIITGCLSFFALLIRPLALFPRITGFISLQLYHAYYVASYTYHDYYALALVSLPLLFLPTTRALRENKKQALEQVFLCLWFCAAVVLTLYFVSGLANLSAGIQQMGSGSISFFHPQSVPYFILYQMQSLTREPMLAKWAIAHYNFLYPFVILIFFEKLLCPLALYKTKMLPFVGIFFLFFHFSNALFFGLPFSRQALMVLLFLILNPIQNKKAPILK